MTSINHTSVCEKFKDAIITDSRVEAIEETKTRPATKIDESNYVYYVVKDNSEKMVVDVSDDESIDAVITELQDVVNDKETVPVDESDVEMIEEIQPVTNNKKSKETVIAKTRTIVNKRRKEDVIPKRKKTDAVIETDKEGVKEDEIPKRKVPDAVTETDKEEPSTSAAVSVEEKDEAPSEEPKNSEPEQKQNRKPLVPENFFKTYRKNFADMTRDDLEEFCILKIVESIIDRSSLNETKTKLKLANDTVGELNKNSLALMKQNRELQVVLKSIQEEQKKNSKTITPLKITRSVGIQVLILDNRTKRKMAPPPRATYSNNPPSSDRNVVKPQPKKPETFEKNQQIPMPTLANIKYPISLAQTANNSINNPIKNGVISETQTANDSVNNPITNGVISETQTANDSVNNPITNGVISETQTANDSVNNPITNGVISETQTANDSVNNLITNGVISQAQTAINSVKGPVTNDVNTLQVLTAEKRTHIMQSQSDTVDLTDEEPPAKVLNKSQDPAVRLVASQNLLERPNHYPQGPVPRNVLERPNNYPQGPVPRNVLERPKNCPQGPVPRNVLERSNNNIQGTDPTQSLLAKPNNNSKGTDPTLLVKPNNNSKGTDPTLLAKPNNNSKGTAPSHNLLERPNNNIQGTDPTQILITKPNNYSQGNAPSKNQTVPLQNLLERPDNYSQGTVPSKNQIAPSKKQTAPSKNQTAPSQNLLERPNNYPQGTVPRKVFIPRSGTQNNLQPGQPFMVKSVAPSQAPRPRNPAPIPLPQAPHFPRAQGRHPAPLPDAIQQYQQHNWKALPPAPDLKLSKVEKGIVISWKIEGYHEDSYEEIASYQLFAYQEPSLPTSTSLWKKIGDVKALPLPMACTLTQFMAGYKYYFAVRAVDIRARLGPFSLPGSILLLHKM